MVADDKYIEMFSSVSNLHILNPNTLTEYPVNIMVEYGDKIDTMSIEAAIIRIVDAIIVIGGSMFIENDHWREWLLGSYHHIFNSMNRDIPLFFMGCNFGPYTSEEFFQEFEKIFQRSYDICFREKESYELFQHLPNVRQGSDVIFGSKKYLPRTLWKRKRTLGISLIDIETRKKLSKYERIYQEKIVEIIEYFAKKKYQIFLFPFCCEEEKDDYASEKVINLLSEEAKERTTMFCYQGNLEEMVKKYSSMEYMICTRFHAVVLSLLFQQKILPLIYSKKTKNMLNDVGYQGTEYDIKHMKAITVEQLKKQMKKNRMRLSTEIEKNANLQFLAFEQWAEKMEKEQ